MKPLTHHFHKIAITFIFLIAIILLACSLPNKAASKFAGNWYTCSKDGLYLECFIKDKFFIFAANNGIITQHENVSIIGDTLIYSDSYLFKDSLVIKKAILHFVSDKQFTLDFPTSNEHWIFYKLAENIPNMDNPEKLLLDIGKRAKKYHCIDTKTGKDSLEKIYFQF